jgi:hypothetical protein
VGTGEYTWPEDWALAHEMGHLLGVGHSPTGMMSRKIFPEKCAILKAIHEADPLSLLPSLAAGSLIFFPQTKNEKFHRTHSLPNLAG